MFARLTLFVTSLAVFSAALPANSVTCNTGSLQCCDNLMGGPDGLSPVVGLLLESLDVVTTEEIGLVGVNCSPLSKSGSCPQQSRAVCCSGANLLGGRLALDCIPASTN